MLFRLQKTPIYRAVIFRKSFYPDIIRLLRIGLLTVGGLALFAFILSHRFVFNIPVAPTAQDVPVVQEVPDIQEREYRQRGGQQVVIDLGANLLLSDRTWKGFSYIFLPLGLFLVFFEIFYEFYLKYPKLRRSENVAEFLSFHMAMIFDDAFVISRRIGEEALSIDTLLWAFSEYKPAHVLFYRIGVEPESVKENIVHISPNLKNKVASAIKFSFKREMKLSASVESAIVDAAQLRNEHKHERVDMSDLFAAFFDTHEDFQKLVVNLNLDKSDLVALSRWREHDRQAHEKKRRWWSPENLLHSRPIGVGWVYGYPSLLSKFSSDMTLPFRERVADMKLVGREKILKRMQETLIRGEKQNVLLVGEPGVGKRAITLKIAQMISEGDAHPEMNYKRILELNVNSIVSSSTEISEVQKLLTGVLNEAGGVGNVILFIDGIHNFIGQQEGLGKADITQVLLPYLQSSNIQLVATTVPSKFHENIGSRTDLLALLERIDVEEPNEDEVLRILQDKVREIEAKSGLFFMYAALKTIYDDANSYIQAVPFPEKALSLLSEVVSYVKSRGKNLVEVKDVNEVITRKTEIPVGEIKEGEKEKLIGLGEEMHKRIVGQNYAVRTITKTMQRLRAGLSREEKPAGVFLFVGPTGVGKTLTSKVLADIYFGDENKMIRFDMSEFQTVESVERLLGSASRDDQGQLVTAVRDNPFSVLLLDEFEKAHPDILNVFLRIFDEGMMSDIYGRKVNFRHNIIIATSNAGAAEIREMVEKGEDLEKGKQNLIDLFIEGGHYRPELLNRFDEIVIYHPLDEKQIKEVARIMIDALVERLKEKGYYFKPTKAVIDHIARVGFDPQFGARPMGRAIQDRLESYIARLILEDKIKKGVEFTIPAEELGEDVGFNDKSPYAGHTEGGMRGSS